MKVSIIIITLNEVHSIEKTIKAARKAAQFSSGKLLPIEIIVCDGGSNDGTIELVNELADKVIIGARGRYKQLNKGASVARGDVFLFLHADTILPEGGILKIFYEFKRKEVMGGGFRKYWNWDPNVKRTSFLKFAGYLWEASGNWLVHGLKSFPGDNAIFVHRNVFEKLNGFAPLWICEDFDFSRRLKLLAKKKGPFLRKRKQLNKRVSYIKAPVLTSTRRFEKYGFFNVLFIWFGIYWLWRLGMPSDKLRQKFKKYSTIPEKKNTLYLRF